MFSFFVKLESLILLKFLIVDEIIYQHRICLWLAIQLTLKLSHPYAYGKGESVSCRN